MSPDQGLTLNPQAAMNQAVDNYLALSAVLRDDLNEHLECETDTAQWRRNFIRITCAMIEGNIFAIRSMCAVSKSCESAAPGKEKKILELDTHLSADENFKRVMMAAYKLFEVPTSLNCGTTDWTNARAFLKCRHGLMHPKRINDLEISETDWESIRSGAVWMIENIFNFIEKLQEKYIPDSR